MLSSLVIMAVAKSAYSDEAKPLSVKFLDDDPCRFSIQLSNISNSTRNFRVSFGKDNADGDEVPGFTRIYVKDQDGRIVSRVPGREDGGYTWLIYKSQIDELPSYSLAAGESVSATFSLKKLCMGLFENTNVQKEKIGSYQIKITTMVYLDKEMKKVAEAETAWVNFPPCLTE